MKKLIRFLGLMVLFMVIIFIMLPKKNLYYYGEKLLEPQEIIISDESFHDYGLWASIQDGTAYVKGIPVAQISYVTLVPAFLYNSVKVSNVTVAQSMQQFLPRNIETLSIKGTVLYPTTWWINGQGDFGSLKGTLNLKKRTISLMIIPSENFAKSYPALAKNLTQKEDYYIYESTY